MLIACVAQKGAKAMAISTLAVECGTLLRTEFKAPASQSSVPLLKAHVSLIEGEKKQPIRRGMVTCAFSDLIIRAKIIIRGSIGFFKKH